MENTVALIVTVVLSLSTIAIVLHQRRRKQLVKDHFRTCLNLELCLQMHQEQMDLRQDRLDLYRSGQRDLRRVLLPQSPPNC